MPSDAEAIKIVCAMEKGIFQKKQFRSGKPLPSLTGDADRLAERFLEAFRPENLTREMSARYEKEGFVLVFRTDTGAMETFADLLRTHGGAKI